MMKANSSNRIKPADLHVKTDERPGWVSGSVRRPSVGEEVMCTGGHGVVVAVRGKTGDGTPLVQIQLEEPGTPAFYAAASNVLIAPPS